MIIEKKKKKKKNICSSSYRSHFACKRGFFVFLHTTNFFFAYNLLCQHFVSILLRGSHYGVVFIHGFYTIFIKSIVFHHNLLSFGDRILLGEL